MISRFSSAPPAWFKVAATVLILWGLMGLASLFPHFAYDPSIDPDATAWDREFMPAPLWLNIVYVGAVVTGVLASVGLLMRRRWAVTLSVLSLLLLIVQFGYIFLFTGIVAGKGLWTAYFPAAIVVIQLFQLWLARKARASGWLK
ncbi:hypothetical protein [Sphingomonas turrisvirgatae]|uniref:Sugar transporter n=1 Tax=Sphingomonas turrisvirgatae TaxID=1888892 RepID=A0A1E3LTA9_9SPHN|nr:hypothetical protein [Sphingomonas turrisvirgatae]ODP36998.1 hypothetical protein BFL28_19385 [Sphingomonas turrisvirgatae]